MVFNEASGVTVAHHERAFTVWGVPDSIRVSEFRLPFRTAISVGISTIATLPDSISLSEFRLGGRRFAADVYCSELRRFF